MNCIKKIKILKRKRINQAFKRIFDYPLTIVEAPVGYGKTTAVKEFLAAGDNPVLWFSFLTPEDTTSFFWDEFSKQIGELDEALGVKLKGLGFPSDAPGKASILTILNNLECKENTVFVIDDYHFVKNVQIGELITHIAREELDNFHMVVITRDTTNIDFADLASKGLCHIISQQLLKFTSEEIRDYCSLMGSLPAESDLAKISEYTGGWISLIYLVLLGLEKGIPVGINTTIYELVERNLYGNYDNRIQQFLSKLAVMDRFSMEQAAFVTQESKTEEFLTRLRRENAFIIYDEPAGMYEIHHVLLDFLRMKQNNNEELKELYKRAGQWHLKQKEYVTAYGYLYRAGEAERILSFLNDEVYITNYFAIFEGSYEMFATASRELLFEYPLAYLQYIGMLLLSGDAEIAGDGASRLEELQEFFETSENVNPGLKKRVLAEINVIRIFAVFNDAEKMIACNNEALRLLEGGHSYLMKKESEFTFGCPHFLYSYYKEPGRMKRAVDIIAGGFPAFARIADGCGTGCEYLVLAEYALETGNWQDAELNALKAIYKAKTMDQTGIVICANFSLVRLYISQGRAAEGLELLKQLHKDVEKENSVIYNTTLDLCEGYIYGCLGRVGKIPLWLQEGDMSPANFLYQGIAFNYIVYGKAVLLSKNYIELEMLTETFDQYFSIFNNQLGFLHNHIFAAAARYRLYGMEAGRESLQKALDLGMQDHIILPFAENAPAIIDMLRTIYHADTRNEYVRKVLLCSEQYLESLKDIPHSTISLSAREREVLSLTAEGLKRDEIAERLMVSTGTVRTHLRNIYQKLEAGSKIAAIKKAEKLQLL